MVASTSRHILRVGLAMPQHKQAKEEELHKVGPNLIAGRKHVARFNLIPTKTFPQTPKVQKDAFLVWFAIVMSPRKLNGAHDFKSLSINCYYGPARNRGTALLSL